MKIRRALNFMRSAYEPAMIAHLRKKVKSAIREDALFPSTPRQHAVLQSYSIRANDSRDDSKGQLEHAEHSLGDGAGVSAGHDRFSGLSVALEPKLFASSDVVVSLAEG